MTTDELTTLRGQLGVGAARVGWAVDEITVAAAIGAAYVVDESQRREFLQQRKWELARMIFGTWAIPERRESLARDFPKEVKAVEAALAAEADPMEATRAASATVTDEMVASRTLGGHELLGTLRERKAGGGGGDVSGTLRSTRSPPIEDEYWVGRRCRRPCSGLADTLAI